MTVKIKQGKNWYVVLKCKHSEEINNFEGIFFAFSNEQFTQGMEKIGLKPDDIKLIVSMEAGGYMLKARIQDWKDMISRQKKEMKVLRSDKNKLLDALVYELRNHEYCYTRDFEPALQALGIKESEVDQEILRIAHELTKDE